MFYRISISIDFEKDIHAIDEKNWSININIKCATSAYKTIIIKIFHDIQKVQDDKNDKNKGKYWLNAIMIMHFTQYEPK